jgi:hypothetical protein
MSDPSEDPKKLLVETWKMPKHVRIPTVFLVLDSTGSFGRTFRRGTDRIGHDSESIHLWLHRQAIGTGNSERL